MSRQMFRGFRGLETKGLQVSTPNDLPEVLRPQQKDILLGTSYSSLSVVGGMSYGMDDRAAGYDLTSVVVDAYERDVWVYKSVEWISSHQSRLPFRIGRNLDTDDREILDDHPLYRVLNKRANPLESGRVFRKRLSAQVLLSKRGAFIEVTKSNAGTITRLDLLPPDRVRPVPDPYGDYITHFEFWPRYGGMREIPVERIRWVRNPHPTDPFCGTTPLDAAGISVELSHLSRLYNVSFIKNDGRPGGIVGVDTDTLDDQEMERIERRFVPGAQEAGKLTVIGTGPGGLDYVDTTTKPRDMAYGEASKNAKVEILAAFGLYESLFGSSNGSTFENGEQDQYKAWTETELDHLDLIALAFAQDCDDDWLPFIDTKSVDVLELPRRKRREEARQEWQNGLRSIDEYRPLADLAEIGTAYTRALWVVPSKAPIATRKEDEAELGVGGAAQGLTGPSPDGTTPPPGGPVPDGSAPPPGTDGTVPPGPDGAPAGPAGGVPGSTTDFGVPGQTDGAPAGGTAAEAVQEARSAETTPDPSTAAGAVAEARSGPEEPVDGAAHAAVEEARIEKKMLNADQDNTTYDTPANQVPQQTQPVVYEPTQDEQRQAEIAANAAIDAILARQLGVIQARLTSPKAKKGTPFWTPEGPEDLRGGEQPMDMTQVVDADRWAAETAETLAPLVQQTTADSGSRLLEVLLAAGLLAGMSGDGDDKALLPRIVGRAAAGATLALLHYAADAMKAWLAGVEQHLDAKQHTATSAEELADDLRTYYGTKAQEFARSLAISTSVAAVNGGRDCAAQALTPLPGKDGAGAMLEPHRAISRTWRCIHDERTRATHLAADGQVRPIGQAFEVGGEPLRYPADPEGSARETRYCRCSLTYRTTDANQFLLPPILVQAA